MVADLVPVHARIGAPRPGFQPKIPIGLIDAAEGG
jgi:hypothetical protein